VERISCARSLPSVRLRRPTSVAVAFREHGVRKNLPVVQTVSLVQSPVLLGREFDVANPDAGRRL
jgi:hypothetical protein